MEQKAISKSGNFDNLLFQSWTSVISKWTTRDSYFKVGQLFQSEAIIPKWDKTQETTRLQVMKILLKCRVGMIRSVTADVKKI